jgi:ABC-type proline/glycine betaine transport system permease subunit
VVLSFFVLLLLHLSVVFFTLLLILHPIVAITNLWIDGMYVNTMNGIQTVNVCVCVCVCVGVPEAVCPENRRSFGNTVLSRRSTDTDLLTQLMKPLKW